MCGEAFASQRGFLGGYRIAMIRAPQNRLQAIGSLPEDCEDRHSNDDGA
jgi:hypothetical protein